MKMNILEEAEKLRKLAEEAAKKAMEIKLTEEEIQKLDKTADETGVDTKAFWEE